MPWGSTTSPKRSYNQDDKGQLATPEGGYRASSLPRSSKISPSVSEPKVEEKGECEESYIAWEELEKHGFILSTLPPIPSSPLLLPPFSLPLHFLIPSLPLWGSTLPCTPPSIPPPLSLYPPPPLSPSPSLPLSPPPLSPSIPPPLSFHPSPSLPPSLPLSPSIPPPLSLYPSPSLPLSLPLSPSIPPPSLPLSLYPSPSIPPPLSLPLSPPSLPLSLPLSPSTPPPPLFPSIPPPLSLSLYPSPSLLIPLPPKYLIKMVLN